MYPLYYYKRERGGEGNGFHLHELISPLRYLPPPISSHSISGKVEDKESAVLDLQKC